MRAQLAINDIRSIDVDTYRLTYREIGSGREKWDPRTRETADHSLPYMLARALRDGQFGVDAFDIDKVLDPDLRPLMNRIHIREEPTFTALFPREFKNRIAIELRTGDVLEKETSYPRGHAENPMDDEEINQKFDSLLGTVESQSGETARVLRERMWDLEEVEDVGHEFESLSKLRCLVS
jgi:2-methylcitrate dehydratase